MTDTADTEATVEVGEPDIEPDIETASGSADETAAATTTTDSPEEDSPEEHSAADLKRRASLRGAPALLGFALLAGIVVWWFLRARHEGETWDLGAVYEGGQAAWASGHPEQLTSWIATPLVGAVMAIVSRMVTQNQATFLNDLLNVIVVLGAVTIVLRRLRGALSPVWWWVTAFALLSFGPMMSAVWWHQFDVFALVSALFGFDLLRRGRTRKGAAVIGVSVAFKPLAILLPFVLLARRETRRAGAEALGWAIALTVTAQCFMAWRADSLGPLNLFRVLENFNTASGPTTFRACDVENFAPSSVLCQLVGKSHFSLQHIVVLAGVALIAVWVIDALRGQRALSWEVFAFTCALSVMASPVSWSHYQVMLAPLFLLLLVRFTREGATFGTWSGLAAAFLLASLSWRPNGTLLGAARGVLTGATESQAAWTPVMDIAQLAQYALIFTGIMWYVRRGVRGPAGAGPVTLPEALAMHPAGAEGGDTIANGRAQPSQTAKPQERPKAPAEKAPAHERPKAPAAAANGRARQSSKTTKPQGRANARASAYDGRLQGVSNGHALGWCWEPSAPRERVQVAIAIDGEIVAESAADIPRPDLAEYGDGVHGFLIALPDSLQAPGRHHVLALAGPGRVPIRATPSFWHEAESGNGWSDVVFEPGDALPGGRPPATVPKPPAASADPRAVISDGWLFDAREFAPHLTTPPSADPPASADLDPIVTALSATAAACASVGLTYIPAIVPAKRGVLGAAPPLDRRWMADLQARLCDLDHVEILDLRPILRHAARHGAIYHRTDADWNDRGAFFVARALLKEARKWTPALRAPALADLHLRPQSGYRGTLAGALKLELVEGELVRCEPAVEAEDGVVIDASRLHALRMPVESQLAEAGSVHVRVYANPDLPEDARLAVVGDSGSLSLVPWLAEGARRTTFFWSSALPLTQLEIELAPVVLHLIRETDLLGEAPCEAILPQANTSPGRLDQSTQILPGREGIPRDIPPDALTAPRRGLLFRLTPPRGLNRREMPNLVRQAVGKALTAGDTAGRTVGTAVGKAVGKAHEAATLARAALRTHAWTIAAVLLITALSWPFVNIKGGAGLDNSWVVGLSLAVAHGLVFGEQVIFTYGPLGLSLNPVAVTPGTFLAGEVLGGLIQVALVSVLLLNLRRRMGWVSAGLLTLIAASLVGWVEAEPLTAIVFGLVALTLTTPAPRAERAVRALAIGGGALAGFALLVKLNDGVAAGAIVAAGVLGGEHRRRDLALGAASLLSTLVALWLILGEPLGALPDYLRNSYDVVSGYVEAMGHNEVGSSGQWQALVLLGSALALAAGAWSALSTGRPRRRWALVGAVGLVHYFVAREMFVRYDGGHVAFLALLVAVALMIPWRREQRATGLAFAAMLAVASFAVLHSPVDAVVDPFSHAHRFLDQAREALEPGALIREGRGGVRRDDAVPKRIGQALRGHCVDAEPVEIAAVWAHPRWRWCPLPVFQSYSAYTPRLDRLNAAAYAGARHGPDRVLRQITQTIDGRNPTWESPLAMLSLLCHFTEIAHGGEWQALARVPDRCGAAYALENIHSSLNHTIALPSPPAHAVMVAAIDGVQVAGWERLETLFARAKARYATVNGRSSLRFRVTPGTAQDGLILAVPADADYAAPFNLDMNPRTLRVEVEGHGSGSIAVRLFAVPIQR
jgi:hypothetical protein